MANQITWPDVVNAIQTQGLKSGLSNDQIDAAIAVARAEGGWTGVAGDNGTSFGVFQFHIGGVLNGFADWLGVSLNDAASVASSDLSTAVKYALQPGGYLFTTLQQGSKAGYSGANLAYYLEQNGQRAAGPDQFQAAADWYTKLFGGTGSTIPASTSGLGVENTATGPQTTTVSTVTQKTTPFTTIGDILAQFNSDATSAVNLTDPLAPLITTIANAGSAATSIITQTEQTGLRLFWILLGVLIAIVGLWVLVEAGERQ